MHMFLSWENSTRKDNEEGNGAKLGELIWEKLWGTLRQFCCLSVKFDVFLFSFFHPNWDGNATG